MGAALWLLSWGEIQRAELASASVVAWRRPTGEPQLVSVEPLPAEEQMCEWAPASANLPLSLALRQESGPREAPPSEAARNEASKRKPVRTLKDPYPGYSSVAVDPLRNEVVMTDESLFSILVYDRMENTPPKARMSEPKRMLQGVHTEIEFQCGIYIDPASGDIYSVNNDTMDKLIIFPHQASGDAPPARMLKTPHSTYGIAVDEKSQEMFITVQDDSAVIVFRKSAKDEDGPVRSLQGSHTLLADPHGIAFDSKKDLIFVSNWGSVNEHKAGASLEQQTGANIRSVHKANWPLGPDDIVPGGGRFLPGSITVYPRTASGDAAPLRVIQGPRTQLNWPSSMAVDPERNELYVANDPDSSILVFSGDSSGDVAPIRVIKGPKSLLKNPTGIWLDLKNGELWASNFGNHTATVYRLDASGDAPPVRTIRSAPMDTPAPMMGNPHTIVYDSKRDEILVAN
jgi:DNA-binding beta-propeller fold protein YncE